MVFAWVGNISTQKNNPTHAKRVWGWVVTAFGYFQVHLAS
jgi:hypothetical protein